MNYFWANLFDYVKERRNVMLFFVSLVLLPVFLLLGFFGWKTVEDLHLVDHWPIALPVIGLIIPALVWGRVRRRRTRRLNRYKSSPLSRDEKSKARSKLMRTKR